jgi:hypothetical protein
VKTPGKLTAGGENTAGFSNDVKMSMSMVRDVRYIYIFEGSLEVKLPTIWTVEKQR